MLIWSFERHKVALLIGMVLVLQACSAIIPTGELASTSDRQFNSAKTILDQKCASCHNNTGSAQARSFDFSTAEEFANQGLLVPGKPNESKLIYRLKNYPGGGAANMPTAGVALTDNEYQILTKWITNMDSPTTSSNPFKCDPSEAPNTLDAKRLSKLEYYNALQSLIARAIGDSQSTTLLTSLNVLSRLPGDSSNAYSTGDVNFSAIHAKEFFEVAAAISTALIDNTRYANFVNTFINYDKGTCTYADPATLNQTCRDKLIKNFTLRAWGRPIETTTTNLNNEFASFQAEFQLAANTKAGVDAMIFKTLLSPQFLYHLQTDVSEASGNYRLSSHAIARRLAFIFTQTIPDETLLTLASTKDLMDEANFLEALTYVSGKSDPMVQTFAREWLHVDKMPSYSGQTHPKFALVTQGFTANDALRTKMADEVVELVSYVNKNNRSVKELFTSNISFARDPSLMAIYGQSTAAPATVTEQNAVRFPASERSGLLTRAAMLFSGNHTENPVLRGIHIRKYMLCLTLANPPANLGSDVFSPPVADPSLTTRERYKHKTSSTSCMGCHSQINPVGFAFSKYNAFGAFQPLEPIYNESQQYVGQLATDASVNLKEAIGIDKNVQDSIEFSEVISDSAYFKKCMSQNFYSYVNNLPTPVSTTNSCSLQKMYQGLDEGASLNEFFKSTVLDSRFRFRKISR